jgi:hypothetical protein
VPPPEKSYFYHGLLGVFLDDHAPAGNAAPGMLDFNPASARDYLTIFPELKQVFFIGDGLTEDGSAQQVMIPGGARRLFLGTMDGCCWNNNSGSFTVRIVSESELRLVDATPIPDCATLLLVCGGLGAMISRRKRP